MFTVEAINTWIQGNVLDSKPWDDSSKQELAIKQAERNLNRWYPDSELNEEVISYQAIWELQGIDPALKYQKQGVKYISDNGERIDYSSRDKVAPEVREILGIPFYEQEEVEQEAASVTLHGGMLL